MTSSTNPKTVELYGHGIQHEAIADAAIIPGMLVERVAPGEVRAHATANGAGSPHFANEYTLTGETINDAYETGDNVIFSTYAPGSGVYALLPASAAAVVEGEFLVSNGDGTLRKQAATTTATIYAQALEAVNNSANATRARIRVEIVSPFSRTLA